MQCSLHYHRKKDETFYVLSGECTIEIGGLPTAVLTEGMSVRIEPASSHRFGSKDGCILIETSTHHDDADVFRLEESRAA